MQDIIFHFPMTGKFMMQSLFFFMTSLLASQANSFQSNEKIWF